MDTKQLEKLTGEKWHNFDDILTKELKSKTFRKGYYAELTRLNLTHEIREARKVKKMTQAAVAKKADMPQSVIARIETGKHSITLDTLSRIARALGKEIKLV